MSSQASNAWRDITALCRAGADALDDIDSFIAVESFTLKDTMASVELMDKKMDQCCGLEGSIESEELLTPFIPAEESLDMNSLLNILRVLFVYEAGFLDGASVLESTHTCVYLWEGSWAKIGERKDLIPRIILAYCRSLHQSLRQITKIVLDVDIYEDEDFQALLAPMLGDSLLEEDTGMELTRVINELDEKVDESERNKNAKAEVLALLRVRLSTNELVSSILIGASLHLSLGTTVRSKSVMPTVVDQEELETKWRLCDDKLQASKAHLATLQTLAHANHPPQATSGAEVDEREAEAESQRVADLLVAPTVNFAFSSVVCKLAQNGPIRRIFLKPYAGACDFVAKVVTELLGIRNIQIGLRERAQGDSFADLARRNSDTEGIERHNCIDFDHLFTLTLDQADRNIHLLPRCVLCAYLNYLTSVDLVPYHLPNSLERWGIPKAFTSTPLLREEWMPTSLAAGCWDTLRMLCTHRNKILPRSDALLGSWGHIISEAQFLDEKLCEAAGISDERQQWCTYWCMTTLTQVMILHWKLLAECELLSPRELDYFYWYGEYLYSMTIMSRETLLTLTYELQSMNVKDVHQEMYLETQDRISRATTQEEKVRIKDELLSKAPKLPERPNVKKMPFLLDAYANRDLCRGLTRVAVASSRPGLDAANCMKDENPYCSWETRFMRRFQGFASIAMPYPLAYETYQSQLAEASAGDGDEETKVRTTRGLLDTAGKYFTCAKRYFDDIKKLDLADVPRDRTSEECRLEDQLSFERAKGNMRLALTCWASTTKLAEAVKSKKEAEGRTTTLVVDSSLSLHFPTLSLK